MASILSEAFDDEAHPETVRYWNNIRNRNNPHTFAKHPIMAMYGNELTRASHEHTASKAGEHRAGYRNMGRSMQSFMRMVQQVIQLERRHSDQLIDLAKNIVVKIWGVPKEMLQAELTPQTDVGGDGGGAPEQDNRPLDPALLKYINKRITLNTLTHGSAVHAMLTMHHLVDEAIREIDPRLLDLYSKTSSISHQTYWLIGIPNMQGMRAAGSTRVEYGDGDGGDGEEPRIIAKAVVFPVLCQELSKGVAELLSHHGLQGHSEDELRHIYKHADVLNDEVFLVQVGPELWRRFLRVLPRGVNLANLYMLLAKLEPDELHNVVAAVVEEPERAKQILSELVSGNSDEEPEHDFEPEDDSEQNYDTGVNYEPEEEVD